MLESFLVVQRNATVVPVIRHQVVGLFGDGRHGRVKGVEAHRPELQQESPLPRYCTPLPSLLLLTEFHTSLRGGQPFMFV